MNTSATRNLVIDSFFRLQVPDIFANLPNQQSAVKDSYPNPVNLRLNFDSTMRRLSRNDVLAQPEEVRRVPLRLDIDEPGVVLVPESVVQTILDFLTPDTSEVTQGGQIGVT